jgi:hypothetical protein
MPTFRCDNDECSQFGNFELIPHVKFVWNETTQKLEANEAACDNCGRQRETVGETGPIQIPWFKPENAKNHNNKTIKKYDYDHAAAKSTTVDTSGKTV